MRKINLSELVPLAVIVAILSTMLVPVLGALATNGGLSQSASAGTEVAIVDAPAATQTSCSSGEVVTVVAGLPATVQ